MNTFAITGMGRSGTKFLAFMLNKSKVWKVNHEIDKTLEFDISKINLRFQKENYGEVSSFLRYILDEIEVEKKCVIIRDPREVFVSAFNRKGYYISEQLWKDFSKTYKKLEGYIDQGIKAFRFEKMTSDPEYLTSIAKYVGIDDITFNEKNCATVIHANPNEIKKINKWDELPLEARKRGMGVFGWFVKKYYK